MCVHKRIKIIAYMLGRSLKKYETSNSKSMIGAIKQIQSDYDFPDDLHISFLKKYVSLCCTGRKVQQMQTYATDSPTDENRVCDSQKSRYIYLFLRNVCLCVAQGEKSNRCKHMQQTVQQMKIECEPVKQIQIECERCK